MNHCTLYSQCSCTAPGFVFPPRYMEIDGRSDQRLITQHGPHIAFTQQHGRSLHFPFSPWLMFVCDGNPVRVTVLDVMWCYLMLCVYLYLLDLLAYTLYSLYLYTLSILLHINDAQHSLTLCRLFFALFCSATSHTALALCRSFAARVKAARAAKASAWRRPKLELEIHRACLDII